MQRTWSKEGAGPVSFRGSTADEKRSLKAGILTVMDRIELAKCQKVTIF